MESLIRKVHYRKSIDSGINQIWAYGSSNSTTDNILSRVLVTDANIFF